MLRDQIVTHVDYLRRMAGQFPGHCEVDLPPVLSEQRPIGDVADQGVLEPIAVGRRTAANNNTRIDKVREHGHQLVERSPHDLGQQAHRKFRTDDGSVLGDLLGETELIELRHQRVVDRVRHSPAASSPSRLPEKATPCAAALTSSSR